MQRKKTESKNKTSALEKYKFSRMKKSFQWYRKIKKSKDYS